MLFLIGINLSMIAQSYVPLNVTGWNNGDLIANDYSSSSSTTSESFDNSGNVYYSTDYHSPSTAYPAYSGIPSSLTSTNGPVYNIGWVNSTLILEPNGGYGTLTFLNPGSFDHLSLLSASANSPSGNAILHVTVNFSDNIDPYTTTFTVHDWYSGLTNVAVTSGRVNRSGDVYEYTGGTPIQSPPAFKLFDEIIDLTGYTNRVVTSIYCWNEDANQRCGVFAVCGVTSADAPLAPVAGPFAPSDITGPTSFTAHWVAASDDPNPVNDHYVLDVSTDPNFASGFVTCNGHLLNNYNVDLVTSYALTGCLTPGVTYHYRVRGVNYNNLNYYTSPNSNVVDVPLPACANPTSGGVIATDQAHCGPYTTTPPTAFTSTADPTGYVGTLEYKWQYSIYDFTTWTDILSSNSSTYAPGLLTVTTKYKRLARVTCMSNWTESNTLTVTINTIPTAFNVTGGGSYCAGGTGVVVGLSGSALGVSYQLYNNDVPIGLPVTGTGALNFGLQTAAGTYTVVASNATTSCTNNMSGSATVIINPLPTPVISGPTSVAMGSMATYTTPLVSGHTYTWSVVFGTFVSCGPNCITVHWPWYCNIQDPGRVTVIETNTATGCVQTVTLLVTIIN